MWASGAVAQGRPSEPVPIGGIGSGIPATYHGTRGPSIPRCAMAKGVYLWPTVSNPGNSCVFGTFGLTFGRVSTVDAQLLRSCRARSVRVFVTSPSPGFEPGASSSGVRCMPAGLRGLFQVGFLKPLSKRELVQLADALQPHTCEAGDYMIRYGQEPDWFYVIVEGVVEVRGRDSAEKTIKVCEFAAGDCVGELEFIHSHRTVADVVAATHVRAARLNRQHFEMCMGPVKDLLARAREEDEKFSYYQHRMAGDDIWARDGEGAPGAGMSHFVFGAAGDPASPLAADPHSPSHKAPLPEGKEVVRRYGASAEEFDAERAERTWAPWSCRSPRGTGRCWGRC